MSGPVTFGDLLDTAREHLDQAGEVPGRLGGGRDLLDVTRGMHDLVAVIGGYLREGAGEQGSVALENGVGASPWPVACARARRAAARAARLLRPAVQSGRSWVAQVRVTERGRHLDAAARALVAGRDVLAVHLTTGLDGARAGRSAWAPVVCSPAVDRAVVAEMGALARQVAALGAGLVTVPWAGWEETSQARRDLAAACQSLRMLAGAVRVAYEQEPVLAVDRELLRAIPAAVLPPRRLPDGTEPVAELCQGVISAAERLRYSVMAAARQSGWSPQLSAGSLRSAAAASVAAAHNCAVLLHAVADRSSAAWGGDAGLVSGLQAAVAEAIAATERARDGWLRVTRELDQVASDIPGHVSLDASDARDLALWTGRLAYADPQWTLATGPRAAERTAADLALGPQEAAAVVAAVHHASESVLRMAEVQGPQMRSAGQAGRFLVPTRSLPDYYDIPRPYGLAPPDRIYVLQSAYAQAREACSAAEQRVAHVAEMARSPSTALTRARELASVPALDRQTGHPSRQVGLVREVAVYEPTSVPGPVERSLQMLGVADPERVRRAVEIDRAGEQLLSDASAERTPRPRHRAELARAVEDVTWPEIPSRCRELTPVSAPNAAPRHLPERQAE